MENHQEISLRTYFSREKKYLILTGITGILYNIGMTAGPLLEGQLAQCLYDILKGLRTGWDMILLSLFYVIVIAIVQGARALKRLYVRKFANNVSRSMKESIYRHLLRESYAKIQQEDTGGIMTRAIADAEACAEGMRKFTTEIYDTGVVMIAYLVTLFLLDWRLTLLVILFPPIAYAASAALKKKVAETSAASKEAMARLNAAAVDLSANALTYRIYGESENRTAAYEKVLSDYERKNVAAGIWQNSPQPVYLVISMIGVIPILWFGGRNVIGNGWDAWTTASFTAFLSCFTKLATKSSHAAKLFNAIQKARVSWDRIKDYLKEETEPDCNLQDNRTEELRKIKRNTQDTRTENFKETTENLQEGLSEPCEKPNEHPHKEATKLQNTGHLSKNLEPPPKAPFNANIKGTSLTSGTNYSPALVMEHVSFTWPDGSFSLHDLNLTASPGEIIGITGRVASGKSTFGKIFLNEFPYAGRILYDGKEISSHPILFAYAGHNPELFTGTVEENITYGNTDSARLKQVLSEVQIDREVEPDTRVGTTGNKLSGGQQARIALARALYSRAPVLILDDPFSAVDADTEKKIFQAFRQREKGRIILLISHRLAMFPETDRVIFLENGTMTVGTHEEMMQSESYAALFRLQKQNPV